MKELWPLEERIKFAFITVTILQSAEEQGPYMEYAETVSPATYLLVNWYYKVAVLQ